MRALPMGVLLAVFGIGASRAEAGLIIEDSLLYYSSGLATATSAQSSKIFGSFAVAASVPKQYSVGWNINYVSRSDNPGTGANTLSGTEMGPRFGLYFGKSHDYSLALTWHAIASATYSPNGGTAESWQGGGFQGELGFAPQIAKNFSAGFKIVYDTVTYSKKTDSANVTSNVSYTQSGFIPALFLSWRFGEL